MDKVVQLEPILRWFVSSNTIHFDQAHDINHILNVVSNATKIYNETGEEDRRNTDLDMILVCCYLHDIRDHKMTDDERTITERELETFILSIGYDPVIVMSIVSLVSFSKESAFETGDRGSGYDEVISSLEEMTSCSDDLTIQQLEYIRNVVSDADKIEALGKTGIDRCKAYGRHLGYVDDDDALLRIVEHCEYKLLHLKDVYIHTKAGKDMAKEGHDHVFQWYESERYRLIAGDVNNGLTRDT